MAQIKELEPKIVWGFFDEITKVPRPSGHEDKIIKFLEDFAQNNGLEYRKDKVNNIVIAKAATKGYESAPGIILQSHVDMVAEKDGSVDFDFLTGSIQTYVKEGWVHAQGTTLGADDGIGMAAAMAVLASKELSHPKIEALFTVSEEIGLTGAFGLGEDMLTGKYLLNLDSEEEGEIFIGCAGGIDTVATFQYSREKAPDEMKGFRIWVKGLAGGHSGDDIEKGRANSNKLLARVLMAGVRDLGLRLSSFDGGNLANAIPREADASFLIPAANESKMRKDFGKMFDEIAEEFKYSEKGIKFGIEEDKVTGIIDKKSQNTLLNAIQGAANGVLAMSHSMEGLVETSSNLASVKFKSDDKIVVTTSQRSSVESAKYDAMYTMESLFTLAGAEVKHSDGYPGWTPDPDSQLLRIAEKSYSGLFGKKPKVKAIHAGLECGIFLKKYPALEMISFGPTLKGVHSPDEGLEIATVDRFWKLIVSIIGNVK